MAKRWFFLLLMALLLLIGEGGPLSSAEEKVRFATPFIGVELDPTMATAEEKGLWKESGVEVQWVILRGTALVFKAVMAGNIEMGLNQMGGLIPAVSTRVPVIAAADVGYLEDWQMWVRAESPIRQLKDLKGGKVGVSGFGSTSHAFTAAFLKGYGLEKDVRILAIGGLGARMAALKTGAITGFLMDLSSMMELKFKGEIREMGSLKSQLPSPFVGEVVFSEKRFLARNPQAAKGVIRATLQSVDFQLKNRDWTIRKLESVLKFSPRVAPAVYDIMVNTYKPERGKIDHQGVVNVRDFLIEYGLVAKEKAPPVEELYTNMFFQ